MNYLIRKWPKDLQKHLNREDTEMGKKHGKKMLHTIRHWGNAS